jgi:thioredoxin 1
MPNFQTDVLESKVPVIVKISASWCVPCKAIDPLLTRLKEKYEHKFNSVEFDVDEYPEVCKTLQVKGVPFIAGYKDGQLVTRCVGSVTTEALERMIDKIL